MGFIQNTLARIPTVFVFALLACISAQAAANKAIVRAVRDGQVQFSKDKGKTWSQAKVGTILVADYAIKTDSKATADLFLGDNGPVVRVIKGRLLVRAHKTTDE